MEKIKTVEELMEEARKECEGCPAWSGTDCTNDPYIDGCEKDK